MDRTKIILTSIILHTIIFFIGAFSIDRNMDILYIPLLLLFINLGFQWYILSKNPKTKNKKNWIVALVNFIITITLSILTLIIWVLLIGVSGIPKNKAPENYSSLYNKYEKRSLQSKTYNKWI